MIGYIFLSIIKIFDNVVSTAKNIATFQEKKILSSVLVVVSQLLFYLVISEVIEDNTIMCIIIVSVSSGIGNLLAFMINDKVKKDAKWCMIFTSSDVEKSKEFSNYLINHNIKNVVNKGYNRNWEDVISIIIFSKSKAESRLIMEHLEDLKQDNFKYLLEVI